ncbi:hypothetical protein [Flavobacterium sp.]|uniref:hypothetical protein n=1 Tax=Flavobacterium sp. TaxID=239 RepID=UPI000EDF3F4F|nr:hypothetical protein [Flavobacterium sp.]HCQ14483.1 hypothetical protein [Flavobacterium sp.]
MKKLVILINIIFFAFCLNSCSIENNNDDNDDGVTYHKFVTSDKNNILSYNYVPNQIITYENQFGEKLHFKVISNTTKKYGDYSSGTFSGGGGILESYYDSKIIRLEIVENEANFIEEQVSYIFSKSENNFKNGIKFPIWNFEQFTFFDEMDRPININLRDFNNSTKIEMDINGHLFKKVVVINSGSDITKPNAWGALLPNNVNKLYYDFEFGIIQFNDIEGKNWKVIYP